MPITTFEDGIEVRFGTGDIMINDTRPNGQEAYTGLALFQDDVREIGVTTEMHMGKSLNDIGGQKVHLIFDKKESIKALMDSLSEIYDQYPT